MGTSVVRKDARRQIAYSVVLEPRTAADPDTQGDWYTADTVTTAAHRFLAKLAAGGAGADLMHDGRPIGTIVESWVTQDEGYLGGQFIKAGTWIAGVHYPDADVWGLIEKGELGAFSVGGRGTRDYGG